MGRRLSIAICVACAALIQVPALADQAPRLPANAPAPEAPTNSRTKEVLTDAAIIAALIAASIAAYRAGGPALAHVQTTETAPAIDAAGEVHTTSRVAGMLPAIQVTSPRRR